MMDYIISNTKPMISTDILYYGVSKRDGAESGSGRYPLGSGGRPYQDYPHHNLDDMALKLNHVD